MGKEEGRKKRRSRRRREEVEALGDEEQVRRPPGAAGRQVYPPLTPPETPAGTPPAQEGPPAPAPPPGVAPEPGAPPPAPAAPPSVSEPRVQDGQAPPPPQGGYPPPPDYYGGGYNWPQYGWYPPAYPPPGYGYGAGYPPQPPMTGYPVDQTGQIPMVPPPGAFPPMAPTLPPAQFPFPPESALAAGLLDEEFKELARGEEKHWRIDFKWVFGIIAAILLFSALTCAGFYRVTGQGDARRVMVPLIESTTQVKQLVSRNYSDLRSNARRSQTARIYIPDVGVEVSIEAVTLAGLSADELTDKVMNEIARQIYNKGYAGNLPMKRAQGLGEERGKATCETLLALLNKNNHRKLLWVVALFGTLAFVFSMLLLLFFCRGWGKASGIGLVLIAASLPGSLFIRLGTEFLWDTNAGLYRGAMYQAFQDMGAFMLMFYDIALGAGALILLIGVIGGVISRRAKKRVPPFLEFQRREESAEEESELEEETKSAEESLAPTPTPPPPGEEARGGEITSRG